VTGYRDIVAKPTPADLARLAGWRTDERCECAEPHPAIVGGNGYTCGPIMCTRCGRAVT
jgi:hypothetical protein